MVQVVLLVQAVPWPVSGSTASRLAAAEAGAGWVLRLNLALMPVKSLFPKTSSMVTFRGPSEDRPFSCCTGSWQLKASSSDSRTARKGRDADPTASFSVGFSLHKLGR